MKAKLKLLALKYCSLDEKLINNWVEIHGGSFEISQWSEDLLVPIQAAIAHYCKLEGIDGLLIDDHNHYDPIVMKRIEEQLSSSALSLYSTTNGAEPVIGSSRTDCYSFSNSPTLVHAMECLPSLRSIQRVAV